MSTACFGVQFSDNIKMPKPNNTLFAYFGKKAAPAKDKSTSPVVADDVGKTKSGSPKENAKEAKSPKSEGK